MNGTVKWFNNQKGFGFIIGEGFKALEEGASVKYDISSSPKGNMAINVVVAE